MKVALGFIVAGFFWNTLVFGQNTAPARPDSVKVGSSTLQVATPPVRAGVTPDTLITAAGDSLVRAADTTRLNAEQTARLRAIKPRVATIRSALLPGLGQAYNRQYWKIPIIYGGFATIGYFFNLMSERTNFYRENWSKAYYSPTRSTEIEIGGVMRPVPASRLERAYSTFRRFRDLNVLLGVALWALNVVDANVTAHLRTFDLSDNLSLRVQPTVSPASPMSPAAGFAPGVRVALTFR